MQVAVDSPKEDEHTARVHADMKKSSFRKKQKLSVNYDRHLLARMSRMKKRSHQFCAFDDTLGFLHSSWAASILESKLSSL